MTEPYSVCVRMSGAFDIADRDRVQETLDAAAPAPYVVIDLSQTDYIDSSVLGSFIRLRNQRIANLPNALGFLEPSASLRRLIEIAGLANVFPFFASLEDAAKHFGTSAQAFKSVDV